MRLEPRPRPEQTVRVSARLITSSTILHFSSDELERAVNSEQIENPTLEVQEQRICLFCGSPLYGQTCATCGHFIQPTQPAPMLSEASVYYEIPAETPSYDFNNYGFAAFEHDDDFDPMAAIATDETLTELLLRQLESLTSPDDTLIAEQLVGNLNERGYLEISTQEIAAHLDVPVMRVEYVLSELQTLEPVGIGARTLRECLLLQLQALGEQETPPALVVSLIDSHLEQLGRNQFAELARTLKVSEQDVREATRYIRSNLHPFPAQTYLTEMHMTSTGYDATYIRPDVIIRGSETGFEVEIIEEKRYGFSINREQTFPSSDEAHSSELQHYMHTSTDRAKFFIDCIHRRWHTLQRVMELIVVYQREFLTKGVRSLRPLTRARIAADLNLDEGTVSRATANKYALLPDGRLMPLSDFFDSSLSMKDVLRELIATENPRHRYSDEELARLMTARGIPVARRTVTKYREEMGTGSSRER